ncbi:MAG: hypothetical protein ACOYJE_05210 [Bacteroidaceae bacterium]|jgi:hypothetical protein
MVVEVLKKSDDANKLYALVLLNSDKLFDVDENNKLLKKANIDAGEYGVQVSTFGDLTNTELKLSDAITDGKDGNDAVYNNVGFYMSNAPLDTNGELTTLVEIDDNNIF